MEPSTKINLPVAYKTMGKIDKKLESLNKTGSEKIVTFIGSNEVEAMFYLYLFKKYKSNCFLHDKNAKTRTIGMAFDIKDNYTLIEEQQIFDQLNYLSKLLVDCITSVNSKIIIIPVQLLLPKGEGHANILIYRKKLNQIEHFEPHGSNFAMNKMDIYNKIIERWMKVFVSQLNSNLKNEKKPEVKFINSSEVCPRIHGLQNLESWSNLTKIADVEPGGYCVAWSLFFTELCLKNPETTSSELMNYIFNILSRMDNVKKMNYLKGVIRGYSVFINEKISKYFTVFFDSGLTIEKLKHLSRSDLSKFRNILTNLIILETNLTILPSYLKHGLIRIKHKLAELNARLKISSNDDALKKQIEQFTDTKNIFEKYGEFNVISNPSRSNSSKPKSVKVEKTCPEGKEINPKTGRCVKVKTEKVKTEKVKTEKVKTEKVKTEKAKTKKTKPIVIKEEPTKVEKTCPEGKELNPKTGRCIKVKTLKEKKIRFKPEKTKTIKVKPEKVEVKENPEKAKLEKIEVKEIIEKPETTCPEGEILKCVKVKTTKVKTTKVKTTKVKTKKVKTEKNEKGKV